MAQPLVEEASARPAAASGRQVKIRLEGVEKSFGEKQVLRGVDLEVAEGEGLVILGGSGTGKSVLLKHIIALLRPDAGRVLVDGIDVHTLDGRELTEFRRRFGMAFQEGALFDSMTVWENVAFPLQRARSGRGGQIRDRVAECLEMVGLTGSERKLPSELSGGMRRRVGFARAIALEPAILLFDEPNTGLDPVIKRTIDDIILHLKEVLGSTTVTITHDLPSAFRIADRIAMLHEGQIIGVAPPSEFRRLEHPQIREFLSVAAIAEDRDGMDGARS